MKALPKNPKVQNWLSGIGTGTLVMQFTLGLPLWLRFILGAVTLICLILALPFIWLTTRNIGKLLIAFLKNYWLLLLILIAMIVPILIFMGRLLAPKLPHEVLEARKDVIQIQRSLSGKDVNRWWAAEDWPAEPAKKFFVREYELIVEENVKTQGQVLRTYIKGGRKIASDVLGPEPYAFARRYYRPDGRNFATEYFDDSGQYIFLEYGKQGTGKPEIYDLSSPVFLPPVPLIMYR